MPAFLPARRGIFYFKRSWGASGDGASNAKRQGRRPASATEPLQEKKEDIVRQASLGPFAVPHCRFDRFDSKGDLYVRRMVPSGRRGKLKKERGN